MKHMYWVYCSRTLNRMNYPSAVVFRSSKQKSRPNFGPALFPIELFFSLQGMDGLADGIEITSFVGFDVPGIA